MVKLLLFNGAKVNIKNRSGDTPLHIAVERQNQAIVKMLIESGADVNAKTIKGQTPLSQALVNLDKELTPLLLSNGAKADFMLYENMKQMHYIDSKLEYQKIDKFLQQYEGR